MQINNITLGNIAQTVMYNSTDKLRNHMELQKPISLHQSNTTR